MTLTQHKSGLWIRPGSTDGVIIGEQRLYNALDLRDGDTVLDVGAHIGAFARWALAKGAGRVVCYEPDLGNLSVLRANVAEMAVEVVGAALTAGTATTIDLWLSPTKDQSLHSTIQHRGRAAVQVPAANFWGVIDQVQPQVVKLDIEGGEYPIFRAGRVLPDCVRAVAIEFHFSRKHYAAWAAEIFAALGQQFTVARAPRIKAWASMGVWNR